LTGQWKTQFEKAKLNTDNLEVENIPCEFYYIKVVVHNTKVDTSAICAIHKHLYNKNDNIGWQVLLVYDLDKKYLFSHRYNGSIYFQQGD
jgi:hypothetical protein